LKVLFQSRLDLFEKKGGDTIQLLETQKALQKIGISVDINNSISANAFKYDLVHIFNLDWVSEPFLQIQNAKRQKKIVVLSPIHHSLKEFKRYEKECRYGLAFLGNALIPYQPLRDISRNLVKGFIYPKKLKPALIQLFMGIRKQQKLAVEMADYILVQTNIEAKELKNDYKTKDFKWSKVVNGINPDIFVKGSGENAKEILGFNKYILCVNRIEPRKNQINLILAFLKAIETEPNFKSYHLVFGGGFNNHHPTYIKTFKKLIKKYSFVRHIGFVEQKNLCHLYAGADVFAYPTWFETTGLVSLEAIISGSRSLVVSGERVKEYIGGNAIYCDPGNINSISAALIKALKETTVKKNFPEFVKNTYTWENCAKQTLNVYKKILDL